ncbi:MAG: VWA domain-containing protein, partial [Deltaproteobacteria bacterium]|nr:VWA domain-containing protein [Deltaproteobacteria bacterium]
MSAPPAISSGAELVTTDGRSLPLVGAVLTGEARGGIARLVLEQRFANRHAEALRVTYRMPLPADGAVSAYQFEIDGRIIAGRVEKKQEARAQFERAVAAGRTAALLEQERADIFTQEIGNLPAGATVLVRITVDQKLVWLDEGEWELRFPTVIGPRYVGAHDPADDARATHVQVAPGQIGARIHIAVKVRDEIAGGRAASSPSHGITTGDDGVVMLDFLGAGAYRGGAPEGARLDRDLVVRWPVARATVGLSLDASEQHGLLTIVPPASGGRAARAEALPRDLTILLDTSGSMEGLPLDTAKRVLALVIDSLGPLDRLELVEFSTDTRRYKREPVDATDRAKRDAIGWLRSRVASGGTEMREGVLEALRPLRNGAQRQVIVVTDGYVGGEVQILEALHDKLPASCRLHVLGVGAAVNRSLATALARAGRGTEVLAGGDEDPERAASRLLSRTRAPMLTEVEIAGSALASPHGHAPEHIPDVFAGA